MKRNKFYITTPAYYVNDVLHIGHAYCTIATDIIARFRRFAGDDVLFLTATDEHGQKIEDAAKAAGLEPIALADKVVAHDRKVWQRLNISYDDFIRTTEGRHTEAVVRIFNTLYEKGDIYKGMYEGLYCTPCETFWVESQVQDNKCADCGRELKLLKEESYFFKLSKYREPLLAYYEKNPDFMKPSSRKMEMINIVKGELKDLSVSRTAVKWGIPVPFDNKHTIYVWFDALINYISAAGYGRDDKKFSTFWPADLHIVGKEIFKFHVIIWPAMLLALGIEIPKTVFGHGWWTVDGQKMSKSKGNVVDPVIMADKYGVDVFRYFLFREVPFGVDGDFSEKAMLERYNTELANEIGNLLNRTLTMTEKYFSGEVPDCSIDYTELGKMVDKTTKCIIEGFNAYEISFALAEILKLVRESNKFIEVTSPWKLAKEDSNKLKAVIYSLLETLRIITLFLAPFMPQAAEKMWEQLGAGGKIAEMSLEDISWGRLKPGTKVNKGQPLFPRTK
jgi:methionyl-tRNA synthetase